MSEWQNPNLSLGKRCVLFSENEMRNKVCEDKSHSYSSPRIREYFSICTRNINGKEVPIPLKSGNWCAAAGSYALYSCILPGEFLPHKYRVGVVEVVADLQLNNLWIDIKKARQDFAILKVGDVVVFDRSRPNEPDTKWFRHFARIYDLGKDGSFQCISGNSGGCWRITNHNLSQNILLGFGSYPSLNNLITANDDKNVDEFWSDEDIIKIAPMEDTGSNLSIEKFCDEFEKIF